jgi:hypothetical protein
MARRSEFQKQVFVVPASHAMPGGVPMRLISAQLKYLRGSSEGLNGTEAGTCVRSFAYILSGLPSSHPHTEAGIVEATLSSRLCPVGFDVGLGVRPVSGSLRVATPWRVWRGPAQGSADTEQTLKRRAGSRHISGMAATG